MRPGDLHQTAQVASSAVLGEGCEILQFAVVRERVQVGPNTRICSHVYLDAGVVIGAGCKIKNGAMIFTGAVLGKDVFIGPGAMLLNDDRPRASHRKGPPYPRTVVRDGATVGAGAIILPGLVIEENALVGAGAVVTRNVGKGEEVVGVPARPNTKGKGEFSTPELELAAEARDKRVNRK